MVHMKGPDLVQADGPVPCIGGMPAISDYMVLSSFIVFILLNFIQIVSATIEEYSAFRDTTRGSFFIQHLCNVLQDHGHEKNLADIMSIVNRKVNDCSK